MKSLLIHRVVSVHHFYEQLLFSCRDLLLLAIRLVWGIQLMQTGWGKFHNLAKVTAFFTDLGIPFPGLNAPFVAGVETFGGLFLALGLFGRLTPLPIIRIRSLRRRQFFFFSPQSSSGSSVPDGSRSMRLRENCWAKIYFPHPGNKWI